MKIKFMVFLALVSMVFMSCVTAIRGNGDKITDERVLPSFERIATSGNVDVRFHSSTEYRAIVTVDSNLNEYFETIVMNNTLRARQKSGQNIVSGKIIVDVYCPFVSEVLISGSGRFEALDKIIVPVFKINISGSGYLNGNIECNSFFADVSGSGDMDISGNSDAANIRISGSGTLYGSEFRVKNYSIDINGSGKADIFAEDYLAASVSGSGSIKYRGDAEVDFWSSGQGKIARIE
jgi:hypothetical protein